MNRSLDLINKSKREDKNKLKKANRKERQCTVNVGQRPFRRILKTYTVFWILDLNKQKFCERFALNFYKNY